MPAGFLLPCGDRGVNNHDQHWRWPQWAAVGSPMPQGAPLLSVVLSPHPLFASMAAEGQLQSQLLALWWSKIQEAWSWLWKEDKRLIGDHNDHTKKLQEKNKADYIMRDFFLYTVYFVYLYILYTEMEVCWHLSCLGCSRSSLVLENERLISKYPFWNYSWMYFLLTLCII